MSKNEYKADLLNDLRNDIEYAAEYLSAAYDDSQEAFLVALRDVAEAQKGMAKVAKQTRLNRENLYRTLSKHGNPTLSTLAGVLEAVGLSIAVVAKDAEVAEPIPTPPQTHTQEASGVQISGNIANTANNFASAWTVTYGGNVAASTTGLIIGNESSGEQFADIPPIPVHLLAAQARLEQEGAQI